MGHHTLDQIRYYNDSTLCPVHLKEKMLELAELYSKEINIIKTFFF